ncbi:MAG TPA: ASCH domain-containing protein [Tepidisphaeraceae bacterium]|nr:ASCH domain-containing protein [Tepidisphaeraceae bacterium]
MRALSIRQPYAELILRGIKTIEYRSRPTKIIGERFYIYAAGKKWTGAGDSKIWSRDLSMPKGGPSLWMLELAKHLILGELPTGAIVGSAVIEKVTEGEDFYEWHLGGVERLERLRKPKGHPQPVWFKPF